MVIVDRPYLFPSACLRRQNVSTRQRANAQMKLQSTQETFSPERITCERGLMPARHHQGPCWLTHIQLLSSCLSGERSEKTLLGGSRGILSLPCQRLTPAHLSSVLSKKPTTLPTPWMVNLHAHGTFSPHVDLWSLPAYFQLCEIVVVQTTGHLGMRCFTGHLGMRYFV